MTPRPPDPDSADESGAAAVARERLTSDPLDVEWDEDRMHAARPRAIRLNPDGTRVPDDAPWQSEPPEGQ